MTAIEAFRQAKSDVQLLLSAKSNRPLRDLLPQHAEVAAFETFEAAYNRAVEKGEANIEAKAVGSAQWCIFRAIECVFD